MEEQHVKLSTHSYFLPHPTIKHMQRTRDTLHQTGTQIQCERPNKLRGDKLTRLQLPLFEILIGVPFIHMLKSDPYPKERKKKEEERAKTCSYVRCMEMPNL